MGDVFLAEAAATRSALSFWRGSGALRRALYSGGDQGFLVPRGDWRCQQRTHHMVRIHDREAGRTALLLPGVFQVREALRCPLPPTSGHRRLTRSVLPNLSKTTLQQGVSEGRTDQCPVTGRTRQAEVPAAAVSSRSDTGRRFDAATGDP
jgi:hypothetical protein